jgi:hypothetical protein
VSAKGTVIRTVTVTQPLPFPTRTIEDPSRATGVRVIKARGRAGIVRLVYRVTVVGKKRTSRILLRRQVVKQPVTQVTVVGTASAGAPESGSSGSSGSGSSSGSSGCDPNYAGACVPIASDVDCAGGKGNGPAYVQGPVRVIGQDIYRLDADHDGIGCE